MTGTVRGTPEDRLARLDQACGCGHGAVAALLAGALGGIFLAPARWHHEGSVLAVLEVVALVVLASGLGKLVGLHAARREAAHLRRALASSLAESS